MGLRLDAARDIKSESGKLFHSSSEFWGEMNNTNRMRLNFYVDEILVALTHFQ